MECLAVNQQRFASVIDNINKELNQKGESSSVIDNINKELNQKGESSTVAVLKKDLT